MTTIKISPDAKKPTRSEAMNYAQTLALTGKLSDGAAQELLLYFAAPPARRPAKSAMEWVARAVPKVDVRHFLCYVWVSPEGVAYGTDGHRAHIATVEGYATGFYDAKTLKPVDVDGKYPNVDRVLPKITADDTVTPSLMAREVLTANNQLLYTHNDKYVSAEYLHDALNGGDDTVGVHYSGQFTGRSDFGHFLIMGVRV